MGHWWRQRKRRPKRWITFCVRGRGLANGWRQYLRMPPTGLMARRGRGLRALSVRSAGDAPWWRAGYRYYPALAVPLNLTLLIGWPSTVLKVGSMILEFTAIGPISSSR